MTNQPSPAWSNRATRGVRTAATRRRWIAAATFVPLLTGCATSFGAQTSQIYQPGPGITSRSSDVYVLNAFVVTDGLGNGTLVAGLVNQVPGTDTLQSAALAAPTGAPPSATIHSGTIALRNQRLVQLSDSGEVRFGGNLQEGINYTLTLTFANASPVTLTVPVLADAGEFSTVPVGPTPTNTSTTTSPTTP